MFLTDHLIKGVGAATGELWSPSSLAPTLSSAPRAAFHTLPGSSFIDEERGGLRESGLSEVSVREGAETA